MQHYVNIIINSVFIENILLIYFLGMCSFLSISKKVETSIGLGFAVIFVLSITAPANWAINEYLLADGALSWAGLDHINLDFLQFIVFISVIAAMVQLVEMLMDRFSPALYVNLGIFLPLITVNCSILGTSLFLVERDYNLIESTVFGFGSGLGFFLAIVSLATVRKRMRYSNVPPTLRGVGMAMLLTGLISMAFLGFSGISL
ncbi:MAG: NADH:ubiquinone reductase (Na(+)-transporting) subunit E [Flavobacteriaceae bacterium TMED116]|nr:MAG: NADH:ubiquinone reductase (Na(+)-transporting) subunit E [Flavobacteriaceae bacterium TMED116]